MKVLKSQEHGVWIFRLVGAMVRGRELHRLRDSMEPLIRRGELRCVLDLGAVSYVDAAGIGELVRAGRRVRGHGGRLVLAAVPERVRRVLEMTAVLRTLPQVASVADAVVAARDGGLRAVAERVGRLVGEVRRSPGILRQTVGGSCRYTPIPG